MSLSNELKLAIKHLENAINSLGSVLTAVKSSVARTTEKGQTTDKPHVRIFVSVRDYNACVFHYLVDDIGLALGRDSWANKFLLKAIVEGKRVSVDEDELLVPIDEIDYCFLQYMRLIKQFKWKIWKEALLALKEGKSREEVLQGIRAFALSRSL